MASPVIWCGPRCASGGVTAIDGYQMAKKGRTGEALATTVLGSFLRHSRDGSLPPLTRPLAPRSMTSRPFNVVGRLQQH